MHQNGDLTGYKIQFGVTTFNTTSMLLGVSDRNFTASDLDPLTTYMFRVAAVNSDGTGPYSNTILLRSKS